MKDSLYKAKTNALEHLSVLIVEDDAVSLKLEVSLASITFGKVVTAENGQVGLMKYLEFYNQNNDYPDVVIADLEMPVKNGFELIAAIKAYNSKQYIIVVSSNNENEGLVRLIDLGVNKFLFKPINPQLFIKTANEAFSIVQNTKKSDIQKMVLQESEFRFNLAVEGKGDGLWDWSLTTGNVYFSSAWKEMLGFKESEIKDSLDEWKSRVNPSQLENVYQDIQAHLEGKTKYYENEHQMLCKDGKYKWILDRGVVVDRDLEGKPTRLIGTHTDISARKDFELTLREQKKRIRNSI